ncbi:MAG: hypothetical protein ACOY40_07250 [Bacillota bacterium]
MLFQALVMAAVLAVAVHLASYGLYAWREEKNRRGAVGAFLVAWLTLITPLLVWLR